MRKNRIRSWLGIAALAVAMIAAFSVLNDRGGLLGTRDILGIGREFIPARDPAQASQGSGCMPTVGVVSGLTMVNDINAAIAALISSNSGGSAPATDCSAAAVLGQFWLDTTSAQYRKLKYYDGTSWLIIATLDSTNHLAIEPIGGGAASIASATNTDLWSTPEASITVTGTTTITGLASASAVIGSIKTVKFAGALTLTYNATSLILPTANNITTAAGDYAQVLALTSTNVAVIAYARADGTPVLTAPFGTLTNLASATTTDLGTISTHNVNITGTTTITSFGSSAVAASPVYLLKFAGALQLTYNASSMILPGATNITTAANDTAEANYLGSGNWQVKSYSRATANVTGKALTVQALLSGSGATYTAPTNPSPLYIIVKECGGGGGGAGSTANNGGTGGTTSFGTLTVIGGTGGTSNNGAGGAGGTGGVDMGTIIARVPGSGGGAGGAQNGTASFNATSGAGGSSPYGGAGGSATNGNGIAGAANSCSGGSGGGGSNTNGGGGGGSGEYVETLITSPSATYTYTVGAVGSAGAAGTHTGAAGGTGRITVYEYYN